MEYPLIFGEVNFVKFTKIAKFTKNFSPLKSKVVFRSVKIVSIPTVKYYST